MEDPVGQVEDVVPVLLVERLEGGVDGLAILRAETADQTEILLSRHPVRPRRIQLALSSPPGRVPARQCSTSRTRVPYR